MYEPLELRFISCFAFSVIRSPEQSHAASVEIQACHREPEAASKAWRAAEQSDPEGHCEALLRRGDPIRILMRLPRGQGPLAMTS